MSLVHEALRKAEREKQRKAGAVPSAPVAPHQPAPPPPTQTHAPVVHAPVAATPIVTARRDAVTSLQNPVEERSRETNHVLLSALIGCVAIVAIIAIVFLVSNFSSALRQTKEIAPTAIASAAAVPVPQSTAPANPPPTAPAAAPSAAQPAADSATTPSIPSPTLPMVDESKYKISGIMKDPDGKPVAVINGRVAYEGYYIDGATVDKIETDRVILEINGQKGVLRLH
jgi:hypothetical protein